VGVGTKIRVDAALLAWPTCTHSADTQPLPTPLTSTSYQPPSSDIPTTVTSVCGSSLITSEASMLGPLRMLRRLSSVITTPVAGRAGAADCAHSGSTPAATIAPHINNDAQARPSLSPTLCAGFLVGSITIDFS